MWLPTTLRARLLALIVLASLPVAAAMAMMAVEMRSAALSEAKRNLLEIVRGIVTTAVVVEAAAHQALRTLSRLPAITAGNPKACTDVLAPIVQEGGPFFNIVMIGLDGNIFCSGVEPKGSANFSDRPFFRRALHARAFAVGDFTKGRITGQPVQNFSLPVLGQDGEPRAVVSMVFRLSKLLEAVRHADLPEHTSITLIDPAFNVLVQSPPDKEVGKNIAGTAMHQALARHRGDPALGSFTGLIPGQRIHAFTSIRNDGEVLGYAVVSAPEAVVTAPMNEALLQTLFILALVVGAMSAIIFTVSNALVLKRVGALLQATRKITAGDFAARAPAARDSNEFSVLENAFNDMAAKIDVSVDQISRLNRIYAVLTEINGAMLRLRDTDALAAEACRIAVETGGFLAARIYFLEKETKHARLAAHAGASGEYLRTLRVDTNEPVLPEDGPVATALKTATHTVEQDLEKVPESAWRNRVLRFGCRAIGAFPLLVEGKVTGAFGFWSSHPGAFDKEEVRLLLRLAADTSLGLEHIEKEARIARLNRVYAVLTEINGAMLRIRDTDALAAEACRIAVETGGYLAARIYMLDKDATQARPLAHAGAGREYFRKLLVGIDRPVSPDDGPLARSLKTRKHTIEQDIEKTADAERKDRFLRFGCRAYAAFPLIAAGVLVGGLALYASKPGAFDEEEMRLLLRLAADTSLGLEQIEKEARIARLSRIQSVLTEISSATYRIRDAQALMNEACSIAVASGGFLAAAIYLIDKDAAKGYLAAHAGAGKDHLRGILPNINEPVSADNGPLVRSLKTGQHAIEQDLGKVTDRSWYANVHQFGGRAIGAFPLSAAGAQKGSLVLYSATPGVFDEEEVQLLLQLAADTSLGLEHIESEAQLYQLSNFDRVTGLPNRFLFEDRLTQAVARAPRAQRFIGVLALRVERLRQITDTHGWAATDETLRHVTRYLNASVRPGDTVARIGDDTFGILLTDVGALDDIVPKASQLVTDFPRHTSWSEHELITEASMGVATYPTDGEEPGILIHHAEITLNNITVRRGNAIAFYAPALDQRARERLQMEAQLSRALERGELSLVYQPVVRIPDRAIVGAEALLRWNNQLLGQVSPASFVPLAEQTGFIRPIGQWVLETASAQRLAWAAQTDAAFRIAVNVSAVQLRHADFLGEVKRALERTGHDPRQLRLVFELTETELIENIDRVLPVLRALTALGIHLALDDFGTGYSSLGYLRRLPMDTLKIDISFVREIVTNPGARALASSIVGLGHSLDLHIVAEGVETEAQRQVLEAMGCDYAQGYLFSRPVPAAEFERLLVAPATKGV